MKKQILVKGLGIGLVMLFLFGNVNAVTTHELGETMLLFEPTLYVGGSGPGNYSTIGEAISNAGDGDTIFVYDDSSPYYEHVFVYKQIKLQGENKETTVIDGNGSGEVITISADYVIICDFTIEHGNTGIYIDKQSNTTISNNIIVNNLIHGIHYYSSCDYNTVTGNVITQNGENGIYFSSFSEHNSISENIISYNNNGTSLAAYANGEIVGNSFEDNTEHGLTLILWCNQNEIHYNNFIGNGRSVFFYTSVFNSWNFNYWGRSRVFPKPIFGIVLIIPWISFDWRPLLTPHQPTLKNVEL